jgi:cobalt-zinc-cadmium efflux system outer membrane protein
MMRSRLKRAAALCALSAILTAAAPPAARARAQHEGHGQHEQHTPPKPAAKRRQTRRAATPARRAAPARRRTTRTRTTPATRRRAAPAPAARPRDPHEGHETAAPAPSPAPTVETRPAETHEGHTPQPRATPTPTPLPASTPHRHEPQPQQQEPPRVAPVAQPTQQATPARSPARQPTPAAVDHSGHQMPQAQPSPAPTPAGPVLRLEELELMALRNNPTLAQAEAAVRAAEGRRRQAGMMPNPTVGYSAENVSVRRPSETTEHLFFVEQTFPLGGKLSKSRRVFASERDAAEAESLAQRQRVLNAVRALYSEALGAERLVELRTELARLAREAVEITKELANVGQADRPDLLEIEIEAGRADIERLRAENEREEVWQLLAVTVGDPALRRARLEGSLEDGATLPPEADLLPVIMRDSPEVRATHARVERARAALARARAERAPDLFVRGGAGYNQERAEAFNGGRTGAVVAGEVGVRLPLWNRNEGGIAAAEAELAIAEGEVARLGLVLRARLASSLRAERNARQVAERYRAQIVPAARAAYDMYLSNFRQMAASYPQVLIAQRTLFQVQVEYARALVELRRSRVSLRGFLLAGGGLGETAEGFQSRPANEAAGEPDDR